MHAGSPDRPEDVLDRLRHELAGSRFSYVFGSVLGRSFNDESDIDVAVDYGKRLTARHRLDLVERLSTAVGRTIDLIDLYSADPVIKMQVLKYGRPLVISDENAAYSFAMTALSEYFDLKLDRAPVEAMTARPHAVRG